MVEGPSWMPAAEWSARLEAYRRQGRSDPQIAAVAALLERRGPSRKRTTEELVMRSQGLRTVTRAAYVPAEDEPRRLVRDPEGRLEVRLVDAGDRLVIWSPLDGGAVINPRGRGLRALGLYTTPVRGWNFHEAAFALSDLGKGRRVDLVREPLNEHDPNAVAFRVPVSGHKIGYIQRGKAPTVAKRMDAGEDMAAICLRGGGPGSIDPTHVLVASRQDLEVLLST